MDGLNTAVLISVSYHQAQKVCEMIGGEFIHDFDNHHSISDVPADLVEVYDLKYFMDLCNNQEIDLGGYFLTFVKTT